MGRIAVVGGGPAGCAAAMAAAHAGAEVVLFERGLPGKDKPCGDALLPDAVRELSALGVPPTAWTCGARRFDRIELWDARRAIWTVATGGDGWIAARAVIDQCLRDVASEVATLRYRTPVRVVEPTTDGWRVATTAGWEPFDGVVIATGATNALARSIGVAGSPVVGASVSAYARRMDVAAPIFQFAPLGIDGYGWVFPLAGDRVNVGVCAVTSGRKQLQAALAHYLRLWAVDDASTPRGGAGPFWSGAGARWHDPRGLVSCGDSAGLVDPLTGEGIAPALESGRHAGEAMTRFLALGRDSTPLAAYTSWVASTFSTRYQATPVRRTWAYLNEATGIEW